MHELLNLNYILCMTKDDTRAGSAQEESTVLIRQIRVSYLRRANACAHAKIGVMTFGLAAMTSPCCNTSWCTLCTKAAVVSKTVADPCICSCDSKVTVDRSRTQVFVGRVHESTRCRPNPRKKRRIFPDVKISQIGSCL